MISRIRYPTKCYNSDIASRNKYLLCNLLCKKTRSRLVDSPIQVFTRHLNMECFESAVPANFVSYAPTIFYIISINNMNYYLHICWSINWWNIENLNLGESIGFILASNQPKTYFFYDYTTMFYMDSDQSLEISRLFTEMIKSLLIFKRLNISRCFWQSIRPGLHRFF